jgi:hypothetical protein
MVGPTASAPGSRRSARAKAAPALRIAFATATALLLASCSTAPLAPVEPAPTDTVASFSTAEPGAALPRGWHRWIITPAKRPTRYDLVRDPLNGQVVLHAVADNAATGLRQRLDVDPATAPVVRWQWRVVDLIDGADATDRHAEDSPVRLLLFFDGDAAKLPARELLLMETARALTGQVPPYATLVYSWDNKLPAGTVVDNAHTGRVKLVVAGSGNDRLGKWKAFERDYAADYRRAFGEAPGRLVGVGILTDTDNTGRKTEAFYGDIALGAAARP